MDKNVTIESQNQNQIDTYYHRGPVAMGPWTSHIWRSDPRHLGFLLARYKFCAKMLSCKSDALEVGCGDAFGVPIVLQEVNSITCIDFEPLVLEEARRNMELEFADRCNFIEHDILAKPMPRRFDAVYSLDVIEHIPSEKDELFITNIAASLTQDGICIIGTPNIESTSHASEASQVGHINLKSAATLRQTLQLHFINVFLFSMNDEVIHTGYYAMAHYLLGVGCGIRTMK